MPEGMKIEAYAHIPLPSNRMAYLISRSFNKFTMFYMKNPIKLNWLINVLYGILNLKLHLENGKITEDEIKSSGWDISIPVILRICCSILNEGVNDDLEEMFPFLSWGKATTVFNLFKDIWVSQQYYPMTKCIF
jgi:hypothetical protein